MSIEDISDLDQKIEEGSNAQWPADMAKPFVNLQPPEKAVESDTGDLDIINVYLTIQGEGPFHGYPSIFIRLAGCNLQCPGCDTQYTVGRRTLNPPEIVDKCTSLLHGGGGLVVLTGGEPFRQNITPLVKMLLNTGFDVQIETNGCYFHSKFPYRKVTIVCSPKTPRIHPKLADKIAYYKYVLDADHVSPEDGLPTSVLGMEHPPARPMTQEAIVYVQPMDSHDESKTTANVQATVNSVFAYGYLLSLQTHKLLGLP